MKKKDQKKVDDLNEVIEEWEKSGLSLNEFIKLKSLKDYTKDGDKKLEDIATEYFLDHLS